MGISIREIIVKDSDPEPEKKPKKSRDAGDAPPDSLRLKDYSVRKERYFQIDKGSIVKDTVINFSLHNQIGLEFEVLKEASSSSPAFVDEKLLAEVNSEEVHEVVIEKVDIPAYHAYLQETEKLANMPEEWRLHRKSIRIRENSKILMKELLDDPRSGQKIKEVKGVVNQIAASVIDNRDMVHSMLTLSNYDYYTYTHCVNVAIMSVGLAVAAGLGKDEVEILGTGAMLHDIGKTAIPPEILNKQGKLDEYEYKRIQEHVIEGQHILREHKGIPEEAYDAVLQHHEKLSGRGYPYQLRGEDVRLFGRITGIADCYDALTTKRPYKAAFKAYDALVIISKEKENYDFNILMRFIKMLGKIRE